MRELNLQKERNVRHEVYNPVKERKAAVIKRVKRFSLMIFYLSAIALILNFTGENRVALAKTVEREAQPAHEVERLYYSQVIGNEEIADLVLKYSAHNEIDPALLVALMETESNFNPKAINRNKNGSYDRGLCQLNSNTFRDLKPAEFYEPETNIKLAAELLRWCYKTSGNNPVIALAYYNAGYGNVNNDRVGSITLKYIHKIFNLKKQHEEQIALLLDKERELEAGM